MNWLSYTLGFASCLALVAVLAVIDGFTLYRRAEEAEVEMRELSPDDMDGFEAMGARECKENGQ